MDFDKLPNSFVLKTNHDSGGVVVVEDKKEFIRDTEKFYTSMQKLQTHLQRNYYYFAREWQYFNMEPRIFAEELLIGDNGKPADTYKFHIFDQNNDKNNFIQVTTDRFDNYQRVMLNSDWSLAPFGISYDNSKIVNIPAQPFMLKEMFDLAYNLASLFDYVRVDLYQNKNNIYFGELTFTPGAAGERIIPNEWDERLGELWKRKEIINEASK
ncbi:glycosyltransferase [Campylobacter coli]|nr:glycosyl transferase [Campylobacter coli]EJK6967170.1 glycosyltransferase [Campylobacter coli]